MPLNRGLLVLLAAALGSPLYAQPAPQSDNAVAAGIPRGLPLPSGDQINLPLGMTERFVVTPMKLYGAPRSARTDIVAVSLVPPRDTAPATELPDTISIETLLLGAATIVLPLISEDGNVIERRIEVLVVDEVSSALQTFLNAEIRKIWPTATINVELPNSTTAVLRGYIDRAELVLPIQRFVAGFLAARSGSELTAITVVNSVQVTGVQQVQLRVIIAEVNRTKTRALGFDFSWTDLGTGTVGALSNVLGAATFGDMGAIVNNGSNLPFSVMRVDQFNFRGFLNALETHNLGKLLAEPVLTTTSGSPAFFNVGGRVPRIVLSAQGSPDVEYETFGTSLRFVPTVLGEGRIRLDVQPEVSAVSAGLSISVGGTQVPGFVTRTAETTVEMQAGQTFAIAGLLQSRVAVFKNKVPIIGDLPLVGWAFQNKSYMDEETELIIIVTPHLVEAMDQGVCKLPGRESRVPNDLEWYLGGRFEPPCFDDPYKNSWKRHHEGVRPPAPRAVRPYDNYGQPQSDFEAPTSYLPDARSAIPAPRAADNARFVGESPQPFDADEFPPLPAPASAALEPAWDNGLEPTNIDPTSNVDTESAGFDEEVDESEFVPEPPPFTRVTKILSVEPGTEDGWKRAD